MKHKLAIALFILLGICSLLIAFATIQRSKTQQAARPDFSRTLGKRDVMIPMRDGVRLHTEIYIPKNAQDPLPFLIERTPYGTDDDDKGYAFALGFYTPSICIRTTTAFLRATGLWFRCKAPGFH